MDLRLAALAAPLFCCALSVRAQPAPRPDRVVGIAAGDGQACAWTERGRVFCWGNDRYGGVGARTTTCERGTPCSPGPVEVPVRDVVEVRPTLDGTCARRRDGSVVCWGDIAGGGPRATEITGARSLEARRRGICATRASGEPACIGGDLQPERVPAPNVTPPRGIQRPHGSGSHACAIVDGRLWCWGSCNRGECGPAVRAMLDTPTLVEGVGEVTAVALGNRFTCALERSGTVICFGEDRAGALGDGAPARAQGIVRVALALDRSPPPERIAAHDPTPPILHVCDTAQPGLPLITLAQRAVQRGGARVDAYLNSVRGDPQRIAQDARNADPVRCATLIRILETSR